MRAQLFPIRPNLRLFIDGVEMKPRVFAGPRSGDREGSAIPAGGLAFFRDAGKLALPAEWNGDLAAEFVVEAEIPLAVEGHPLRPFEIGARMFGALSVQGSGGYENDGESHDAILAQNAATMKLRLNKALWSGKNGILSLI